MSNKNAHYLWIDRVFEHRSRMLLGARPGRDRVDRGGPAEIVQMRKVVVYPIARDDHIPLLQRPSRYFSTEMVF